MKLPALLLRPLRRWADRTRERRLPDFVIGGLADPYMLRWWVIPRNRFFNIYLHEVIRSDDDRALHDHPWVNGSVLIDDRYVEHVIDAGGIHRRTIRRAGDVKLRLARAAHRLELVGGERVVTLFITGPRVRSWGFHCPKSGWVHWQEFTAPGDYGSIGRGCGETDS
jgi:hypothetical protein